MSLVVRSAKVRALGHARTHNVISSWYKEHRTGALESLLTDALFPREITEQIRVEVNDDRYEFHPLPFGHDNVMLIGRKVNSKLAVVFYDTKGGMFLQAMVVLTYSERLMFTGRRRKQFVQGLVTMARREDTPNRTR